MAYGDSFEKLAGIKAEHAEIKILEKSLSVFINYKVVITKSTRRQNIEDKIDYIIKLYKGGKLIKQIFADFKNTKNFTIISKTGLNYFDSCKSHYLITNNQYDYKFIDIPELRRLYNDHPPEFSSKRDDSKYIYVDSYMDKYPQYFSKKGQKFKVQKVSL